MSSSPTSSSSFSAPSGAHGSSSSASSGAPDPRSKSPFEALATLACPVTITLGTGVISVRQCLGLEPDSILRLAESAGNDLRVHVNGITIARGEVALIDTSTAIRITELAPALPGKRKA